MGLLDYYRQFEGMSEAEVNAGLRERAAERREAALARVEPLDLSSTTWPHLPHPYVVGAVTYVARRGLHRYVDRDAATLRSELAHRCGVADEQVAIGNGASQLLAAAFAALLEARDEVIIPWPAYAAMPLLVRRARGNAVPVEGPFDVDALLSAVNERTRAVAISSPNDPTGERLGVAQLERLLGSLPEGVGVLLDEALVDYATAEPVQACMDLVAEHPQLVVFRSFSKAWGLAGLRCGYAVGGEGAQPLLERLEPDLGVSDLAQAGALESLRSCAAQIAARAAAVAGERRRLIAALRERGFEAPDSDANFVWLRVPGVDGAELADRLARGGVRVAAGGGLGDPARARAAVHDAASVDRLLQVIDTAL